MNEYHQIFGSFVPVVFDIDANPKSLKDAVKVKEYLKNTINLLANKLQIKPWEINYVNRCREGKISYHLYSDYIIKKATLKAIIIEVRNKAIEEDLDDNLLEHIDMCIYRNKGSLRISNRGIIYDYRKLQLNPPISSYNMKIINNKINKKNKTVNPQTEKNMRE